MYTGTTLGNLRVTVLNRADSLLAKHAVIVKVKSANIRKGPGADQPALFTADKGVPFLVVGKKGSWLKVRHADGDEGWIARKLLWGASRDPSNL